jgi:hypothetical protein
MRKFREYRSARGALSNERPYRDRIRRMGPASDAKVLRFAAFDKAEPRFRDARQRCQLTAVS